MSKVQPALSRVPDIFDFLDSPDATQPKRATNTHSIGIDMTSSTPIIGRENGQMSHQPPLASPSPTGTSTAAAAASTVTVTRRHPPTKSPLGSDCAAGLPCVRRSLARGVGDVMLAVTAG